MVGVRRGGTVALRGAGIHYAPDRTPGCRRSVAERVSEGDVGSCTVTRSTKADAGEVRRPEAFSDTV